MPSTDGFEIYTLGQENLYPIVQFDPQSAHKPKNQVTLLPIDTNDGVQVCFRYILMKYS